MAIKVIGAGFGRTGTMSMKLALEQLGLGRCHHMEEVFENPWQMPVWQRISKGEAPDWDTLLDGYTCTVDWPSAHYWREIHEANPGSKVILTVRPVDTWWASYSKTIMAFMELCLASDDMLEIPTGCSHLCEEIIGRQTFGTHYQDETAGKAAFLQRIKDVKEAVAPENLLIYELGSGWEPLCEFLGLDVPDTPFPRSNNRSEFWDNFNPEGEAA